MKTVTLRRMEVEAIAATRFIFGAGCVLLLSRFLAPALASVPTASSSTVAVFRRALSLYDKLFHQPQLVRVFFPEMLFTNFSSLFLPVLRSESHIVPRIVTGTVLGDD